MTKVWLITGCSTGFGKELAKYALEQGDSVVATARKVETLKELEGDVLTLPLDVTDKKSIKSAVDEAINWKGQIDVLVNNAGFGGCASVEETSEETYRKLFDVNVFGLIDMQKAVLPIMRKQKSGHVINLSSVAGIISMPGFGPYCATKHAVEALSEAMAQELTPLGIKTTLIEPGAFKTKFVGNVSPDEISEDYQATAGETKKMLAAFEENAPGDPVKAAIAMYNVAQMDEPPLRLPLGKDALEWATQKVDSLKEQLTAHKEITTGTDFD